ncbi:FCD domain-containing protein [Piscinibacter sakaiensis]|uniref:Transcriptional regulator, GntR family n=1 Tax=Piscinibacter sakaiensis TaxID=1547922 RepID=A0A0K8P1J8_PISS1|nr:FCD domain-containing protein [Piscinibacter sakaiensis]GAP36506.1 transcriptional regulator, GntR family [Piscinibacter sakaiensis]
MVAETLRHDAQTPLTEQAFRRLRRDVLAGTFPPGGKLKIDELQGHYGFSSSPLREALSRLAQEGLVRADERRGFRVAALSITDLADITRMRLMLDPDALADSIVHGGDEWEAQVVAAYHRLERIESKLGDGPVQLSEAWCELHRAFHMVLMGGGSSDRLKGWCASLFDQAERYRQASARMRQTARRKSNEHRRIMEAALRRDKDTACALLREHIKGTERNVEVALRASNPSGH